MTLGLLDLVGAAVRTSDALTVIRVSFLETSLVHVSAGCTGH